MVDPSRLVRVSEVARDLGPSPSHVRQLADEGRCEGDIQTSRSTSEVVAADSIDHDFVRTRTIVRLFDIGVRFISRSEARRLLRGLERFREVLVDLRGVQEVGQGFVDEVFRVWPSQHPDVTVRPMNMVGPVEAMVRRGLPRPERRLGPERSSDG